jgi:serine/threonine-protein kinase
MTDTILLNRAQDTPTSRPGASGWTSLPPEMLEEASQRLGLAGLIYAGTYSLAYFGPHILATLGTEGYSFFQVQNIFALVSIAIGFLVYWLSRRNRCHCQRLLDFGLVFVVVGAFGISMAEFWGGVPDVVPSSNQYMGIPWECVWILIFPLVAPNTPRKMSVALVCAASTGPATVLLADAVGAAELTMPLSILAPYFLFTTYLCAGIAYVMSRVVYRYGIRLKKAQEIGAYELVEPLGEGGMGEVWAGRHRMLARPSAIKLIRPEVLGATGASRETALRRFEREARATAGLSSIHTVSVHDFGVTDDGSFFYVMELLDGLSFETLVKRFGPLSPARAVFLLRQVCHSLDEAHKRGLIHRDIKPANLFACRLGPDYDYVKVLDFGLVKHSPEFQQATELTAEGITAGTPAFMAPEMALGKPVDGRADLYALGCVAYWLVTGHNVFTGETPVATILEHVRAEPVPPSQRAELEIPADFEQVILSCLAKDPADRPQTAAEFRARLAALDLGEEWSCERGKVWWDRHQPSPLVSQSVAGDSSAPTGKSDSGAPVYNGGA